MQAEESRDFVQSALSALKWNYGGTVVRMGCSFGIGVVLARMLGPKPFGQVAIALLVIGLGALMADFGFASGLVQLKDISDEEIRFAFSAQVLLGGILSLIGVLCAGLIARVFRQPEVAPVVRVMMLTFLFQSFGLTAAGMLRRHLQHKATQIAQVSSYLIAYVALGIPLAYKGFGVWALVTAQMAQILLNSVLIFVQAPHSVRPLFRLDHSRLVTFGGKVTLCNLTNWAISNLDNTFVGRFFGAAELGLYSRAFSLLSNPMNGSVMAMQSVLFSATARAQDNRRALRRAYLAAVNSVSTILMPICFTVAASPTTVIVGLYGNRWIAASPLLVPLALAMPLNALLGLAGPLLWGIGRTREILIAQVVTLVATVASFWIACHYTTRVLAWTVFAVYGLWFLLVTKAATRALEVRIADLMRATRGPVFFSLIVSAVTYFSLLAFHFESASVRLAVMVGIAGAVAVCAGFIAPRRVLEPESISLLHRSFPSAAKWLIPADTDAAAGA
jgi:lipopolysaccharide exporter